MDRQILYFADPMCSWCWGFKPVMDRVVERARDAAPVQLFMGGLRPFTDHAMTAADKAKVRNHWDHVARASGQSFDYALFERDGFVYDTEPACRAVVAVRRLAPEHAHAMLNRVHRAFYAENADTTDADTLADLAHGVGVPRGDFQIAFDDAATRQETLADFQYAGRAGISGFPTLIGVAEVAPPQVLTIGFQPWARLEATLDAWLA